MSKLVIKTAGQAPETRQLDSSKATQIIGTAADCDVQVTDSGSDIFRIKIEHINSSFYLQSIEETETPTLNGRPLFGRVQIVDGDELNIGAISMLFENLNIDPPLEETFSSEEMDVIGEDNFGNVFHFEASAPAMTSDIPEPGTASAIESEPKTSDFYEFEDLTDEVSVEAPIETNGHSEPVHQEQTRHSEESTGSSSNGKPSGSGYKLVAIFGPYLGQSFPLKLGDTRIGRDNTLNDVIIRKNENGVLDPSISRRHATISYQDGRFLVTDKRSKTRTYVNQFKLTPEDEYPTDVGDEIEIVSDQKSTIFRIVADDDVDFSGPRKAGVWWLRNGQRVLILTAAIFGIAALLSVTLPLAKKVFLKGPIDNLKLFEEVWYQARDLPGDPQAYAFASLAAADLNGDNHPDLVFIDPKGRLKILDGITKNRIWENDHLYFVSHLPIMLADLNGDALADVIVVGQDARLHAFDGKNGAEIWISPLLSSDITGSPVLADFDGDGLLDVFAATADGQFFIGYGDIFQMDWRRNETGLSIRSTASAADRDGDGRSEIYLGTEDGKLLIIDGATGKVSRVLDIAEELEKASGEPASERAIRAPVAITDFNHNGIADLLIGTVSGQHLTLEGNTFGKLWYEALHADIRLSSVTMSPGLGKLDGDETDDAVLVSSQSVKVLRGSSEQRDRKEIIWEYYADSGDPFISSTVVSDLNRDGAGEVLLATLSGSIFIFGGSDGKIIAQIHNEANRVASPILVADLAGDGMLDVIFARQDGHIYRIQTNSTISESSVAWGQAFGSAQHLCMSPVPDKNARRFGIMSAAFGLVFMLASGLVLTANRSRKKKIENNRRT